MYTNKKSSADPADDFHYTTKVCFKAAQQKVFPLGGVMRNGRNIGLSDWFFGF